MSDPGSSAAGVAEEPQLFLRPGFLNLKTSTICPPLVNLNTRILAVCTDPGLAFHSDFYLFHHLYLNRPGDRQTNKEQLWATCVSPRECLQRNPSKWNPDMKERYWTSEGEGPKENVLTFEGHTESGSLDRSVVLEEEMLADVSDVAVHQGLDLYTWFINNLIQVLTDTRDTDEEILLLMFGYGCDINYSCAFPVAGKKGIILSIAVIENLLHKINPKVNITLLMPSVFTYGWCLAKAGPEEDLGYTEARVSWQYWESSRILCDSNSADVILKEILSKTIDGYQRVRELNTFTYQLLRSGLLSTLCETRDREISAKRPLPSFHRCDLPSDHGTHEKWAAQANALLIYKGRYDKLNTCTSCDDCQEVNCYSLTKREGSLYHARSLLAVLLPVLRSYSEGRPAHREALHWLQEWHRICPEDDENDTNATLEYVVEFLWSQAKTFARFSQFRTYLESRATEPGLLPRYEHSYPLLGELENCAQTSQMWSMVMSRRFFERTRDRPTCVDHMTANLFLVDTLRTLNLYEKDLWHVLTDLKDIREESCELRYTLFRLNDEGFHEKRWVVSLIAKLKQELEDQEKEVLPSMTDKHAQAVVDKPTSAMGPDVDKELELYTKQTDVFNMDVS